MNLLGFGSKFCPRPNEPSRAVYEASISSFVRRFLVKDFFKNICQNDDNRDFDPRFRVVSDWSPPYNSELALHVKRMVYNFTPTLFARSSLQKSCQISIRLKNLLSNKFIKIVQSDKNLGLCVMSIERYHEMVQTHLNDAAHYLCLGSVTNNLLWNHTFDGVLKKHFQLLSKFSWFFPEKTQIFKFLQASQQKLPAFHILPKLHKKSSTITSRPIVGAVSWITTNWAVYLCSVFEVISCPFVLKNSFSLIEKLESFEVLEDDILVTADVSSLYTMMSLSRLYDCLKEKNVDSFHLEIIRFICDNNFFLYGFDVYRQLDGIAMGFNAAVHCANVYLDSFDRKFAPMFRYYGRYIDDLFFIFRGTPANLDEVCLLMNSEIPGIKLTFTRSISTVDFLDLTIFKNNHLIAFRTFQKPLNIYQYLPPTTFHSPACIAGFIKGELIRFIRTNTLLVDRQYFSFRFRERLLARGYSKRYLEKIFNSVSIFLRPLVKRVRADQSLTPLIIPWFPNDITRKLQKFIHLLNLKFSIFSSDFKFVLAFSRNPSLLQLCSRSRISRDQATLLEDPGRVQPD